MESWFGRALSTMGSVLYTPIDGLDIAVLQSPPSCKFNGRAGIHMSRNLEWTKADKPDATGNLWSRGPSANETKYCMRDKPGMPSVFGNSRATVRPDLAQRRTMKFWADHPELVDGLPREDRVRVRRNVRSWLKKRMRKHKKKHADLV